MLCDEQVKSSLQFCKGEWSFLQLPYWTILPSSRAPSQVAEVASCASLVLNWISIQSVLCNHMHNHPTSVPPIKPFCMAHGYFQPILCQFCSLSTESYYYSCPHSTDLSYVERGVFAYMLLLPPPVKNCAKYREWVLWIQQALV